MDGIQKKKRRQSKSTHLALQKKQADEARRTSVSESSEGNEEVTETPEFAETATEAAPVDEAMPTAEAAPTGFEQYYTKVFLEWDPPEFQQQKKTENWYLWLGIAAAILITIAIFTKAYMVAVTFFLLAIVIVMLSQKQPDRISAKLTDTGILFHNNFYPYHNIDEFWILYDPPRVTTLNLKPKKSMRYPISIEIDEADPVKIREVLLEYLDEDEEKEEEFIEHLSRRFRF